MNDRVPGWFPLLAFAAAVTLIGVSYAYSEQCPEGAKACKVLVYTPEQEEALKALIQNTAIQGPYNQVRGAVDFYVKALTDAPAGTVREPEKPKAVPDPPKP